MNEKCKFQKGTIVTIKDIGGVFSSYRDAFFHFGMVSQKEYDDNPKRNPPNDFNVTPWIVENAAIHSNDSKQIVVCIRQLNSYTKLVIGVEYIEIDVWNNEYTPHLLHPKSDIILQKIQKLSLIKET